MPVSEHSIALLDRLRHHAAKRGEAVAYTEASSGRTLTWSALAANVQRIATMVADACPAGGVVILCAANEIDFPASFLGILLAGCDAFCVACDTPDDGLRDAAKRSGAVATIAQPAAAKLLADRGPAWILGGLASVAPATTTATDRKFHAATLGADSSNPDERSSVSASSPRKESATEVAAWKTISQSAYLNGTNPPLAGPHPNPLPEEEGIRGRGALLLQSSGTTGLPKIVRRSARSLDAVSSAMADAIGFTPADHVLAAVPLTHSYGIEHGLLAPVWAGSTVHLCRGLDLPAVAAELARGRITVLPGVPAMFEALANLADAPTIAQIRVAYSAGAPLPQTVVDRFADRFGTIITQLYGATEIGSVTFNSPRDTPVDRETVGRPMRGVHVRLLDADAATGEGHVAIRADSMFDGYLNDDAGLIDGYFPTGDLGRLDERGRLFITGRLKLLIDVGGRKVNPLEVEAVLREDARVADVVVLPVAQSETLNRLRAIIEPRDVNDPPDAAELRSLARRRLAGYKVPRMIEIVPNLPRTSAGKVDRAALAQTVEP